MAGKENKGISMEDTGGALRGEIRNNDDYETFCDRCLIQSINITIILVK